MNNALEFMRIFLNRQDTTRQADNGAQHILQVCRTLLAHIIIMYWVSAAAALTCQGNHRQVEAEPVGVAELPSLPSSPHPVVHSLLRRIVSIDPTTSARQSDQFQRHCEKPTVSTGDVTRTPYTSTTRLSTDNLTCVPYPFTSSSFALCFLYRPVCM